MSRVGKLPIEIPKNVTVNLEGNTIKVTGPKGTIQKSFDEAVSLKLENGILTVSPANESRFASAMHGTTRSIINAMVKGVITPYSKDLEIQGVGMRAQLTGSTLRLNLGYSHVVDFPVPTGITIVVTENTKIKVEGIDKQLVGEVAARIKHVRPVEVYKGKGVRILGEFVRRKEGKKSAK